MRGRTIAYCNAALGALFSAAHNLMSATVTEALGYTPYGKIDTLGLDAIPEIEIADYLYKFDPAALLVTEERG